jgi:hypothetical protein
MRLQLTIQIDPAKPAPQVFTAEILPVPWPTPPRNLDPRPCARGDMAESPGPGKSCEKPTPHGGAEDTIPPRGEGPGPGGPPAATNEDVKGWTVVAGSSPAGDSITDVPDGIRHLVGTTAGPVAAAHPWARGPLYMARLRARMRRVLRTQEGLTYGAISDVLRGLDDGTAELALQKASLATGQLPGRVRGPLVDWLERFLDSELGRMVLDILKQLLLGRI